MEKRGQVTVFIIVGILILVIAVSLWFLLERATTSRLREESLPTSLKTESLQQFLEQCLTSATEKGITFISQQGGYYRTIPPYYEFGFVKIPYYFDATVLTVPSEQQVERELADYVQASTALCWGNLSRFPWKVALTEESTVMIDITPDIVIATQSVNALVYAGKDLLEIGTIERRVPAVLGKALRIQEQILQIQPEFPEEIPLSSLASLAEQNAIKIELQRTGETVFYILQFFSYSENPDYNYIFAMRYAWSENEP